MKTMVEIMYKNYGKVSVLKLNAIQTDNLTYDINNKEKINGLTWRKNYKERMRLSNVMENLMYERWNEY